MRNEPDIDEKNIVFPSYVVVSHSICIDDPEICDWQGFLLEGAFVQDGHRHNSGTGDRGVPAITNQICPNCGKVVFRTYRRTFRLAADGKDKDQ